MRLYSLWCVCSPGDCKSFNFLREHAPRPPPKIGLACYQFIDLLALHFEELSVSLDPPPLPCMLGSLYLST